MGKDESEIEGTEPAAAGVDTSSAGEPRRPEDEDGGKEDGGSRFSRLRRLLGPRELGEDAKHLFGSVLDTSDRAKTELVRMVAREFRHYLDELKLTEDLRELLTSHSLEVNASFSLKPLADKPAEPPEPTED